VNKIDIFNRFIQGSLFIECFFYKLSTNLNVNEHKVKCVFISDYTKSSTLEKCLQNVIPTKINNSTVVLMHTKM